MKALSFWKKSVYSAFVFFGTLVVLSVGYSLVGSLSVADKVGSGSGLTATSWNKIVDGILDLDTRLSNITFSGGSVGIGVSPSYKLDVNGTVNATIFRGNGSSITNINASSVPWSGVSGKPTTVSGYGITDISAWAKASIKPSYGFIEITGTVTDAQVPDTITVNYANTAGSLGGTAIIVRDSDYYTWSSCPAGYSFVGGFSNPVGLSIATATENFWHAPSYTWWCSK